MVTQSDINQLFIARVDEMIEKKIFRNRKEIVDKLNWSESSLSAVMAGRRPVPEAKAKQLFKIYESDKKALQGEGTPIYDVHATGTVTEYTGNLPEVPEFHVKIPGYTDCNFGMYVYGHSMYPTIETGSLVLCRSVIDKHVFMFGEIYLIKTSDYLMVKRLQKSEMQGNVLCVSDNYEQRAPQFKRFEPFDLEIDKIIELYLVKGIIKKTQS